MAWISLAKVLVFIFGALYLIVGHINSRDDPVFKGLWTPWMILAILLAFSLSLLWTIVEWSTALAAFVKHGKLLEILILVSLIRSGHEARIATTAFAAGQVFLLFSSWLMAAGIHLPWATSVGFTYVVFSTYLDQSIIFATTAAIIWHLRSDRLWPRRFAALVVLTALVNVFFLLEGRTGYAVALTVISFGVVWKMPRRLRLATLIVTPLIILFFLYLGSAQVHNRISELIHESQDYSEQGTSESSSGWRLSAWRRSTEAIAENPLLGHGVGSWTATIVRMQGDTAAIDRSKPSNPHQEYLLWGVELGIGGILLLLALMASIVRDSRRFETSVAQATFSVVAAMAVACLFNSTLYDSLIGDYFCIALGLLIALGVRTMPMSQVEPASVQGFKNLKVEM